MSRSQGIYQDAPQQASQEEEKKEAEKVNESNKDNEDEEEEEQDLDLDLPWFIFNLSYVLERIFFFKFYLKQ